MTSSYRSLGIRPVINAQATLTMLGGSLMPSEVRQAMQSAAGAFVDLHQLQRRVGERLAELTRNEAAYVSCGAASGLMLATAACIARHTPEAYDAFPQWEGVPNEVLVQKMHRNSYDYALREAGAVVVEMGSEEQTTLEDLEAALGPSTVAVFWFQGAMNRPSELPLEQVIAACRPRRIPVIVDAAAQLPPASNLWNFTQQGADLAIFSGGKDLRGPQASGLVLGSRELIEHIRGFGAPFHGIGRPMKVGKEEMMGLLAAVERYLTLDHDRLLQVYEERVQLWISGLDGCQGLRAMRDYPNEAGQPVPRTKVLLPPEHLKEQVIEALMEGEPRIAVAPSETDNALLLNPMTVQPGEAEIVLKRIQEVLA
jgi:uncharacterized pyridoxal phosphate-dependent enzyme